MATNGVGDLGLGKHGEFQGPGPVPSVVLTTRKQWGEVVLRARAGRLDPGSTIT